MGLGQWQGVVKQPIDVVCSFGGGPDPGLEPLCHLPSAVSTYCPLHHRRRRPTPHPRTCVCSPPSHTRLAVPARRRHRHEAAQDGAWLHRNTLKQAAHAGWRSGKPMGAETQLQLAILRLSPAAATDSLYPFNPPSPPAKMAISTSAPKPQRRHSQRRDPPCTFVSQNGLALP